jgi:hypothetical protein
MAKGDGFDPAGGDRDKEEGMERARRAAAPAWRTWFAQAIVEVAKKKPFFTTDDVERLRIHRAGPTTHEYRAIGPLMLEAARNGVCAATDDWAESRRRVNHRRPLRVWQSLIYRGPAVPRRRRPKPVDPNQFTLDLDPAPWDGKTNADNGGRTYRSV